MALQEILAKPAEVAHVLSVDIADFESLPESAQVRFVSELRRAASECATYRSRSDVESALAMPSDHGLILVFSSDLTAPVRSAIEISEALKDVPFKIRMGIHSGHVQWLTDAGGTPKVSGKGVNLAQRVMEFADAGHILLSHQYATWLAQFDEWRPNIRPLGETVGTHGVRVAVANLSSPKYGNPDVPSSLLPDKGETSRRLELVLLYRRMATPDNEVVNLLEEKLKAQGHGVFIDRNIHVGVEWAREIEDKIRNADAVVAVVSDSAVGSEMLEYEVDLALSEYRQRGRPFVLPVRVGAPTPLDGQLGDMLNSLQFISWSGPEDNELVVKGLLDALSRPSWRIDKQPLLEPVGGAMAVDSKFYVQRDTDKTFLEAIRTNHSIVLVKGARQIGKTSLLARGVALVNDYGWKSVITDFQKVNSGHLGAEDTFYRMLAAVVAHQLNFEYDFDKKWIEAFGPNINMDMFLRSALESQSVPFVWFMDEADRIFALPFASEFFGLVRSWHNSRAIEPDGPWNKFTLVISYATEAHLFIRDLNQSPFNVGLQIPLQFFTFEQTADLNARYGIPIRYNNQIEQLHQLVGGQPFLTRRALDLLARQQIDFQALLDTADADEGPFGDHLKRVLVSVSHIPAVEETLKRVFVDTNLRSTDAFQRLLTAGVVVIDENNKVAYRTDLYRRFLERHGIAPIA